MQAVTRDSYGGAEVLHLERLASRDPGAGEVRIDVHASSLNAGDMHVLRGEPFVARLAFGLRKPRHRIPGMHVAGVVSKVGAVTALQGLRNKGRLAAGEHVLITGASGGVGSFAIQIARCFGATVTAVTSTPEVELVASLGAHHIIDRMSQDFTQVDERFDVILDCAGYRSISETQRLLAPGGRYVFVGGGGRSSVMALLRGKGMLAQPNRKDLETVAGFLVAGSVTPLLGGAFPLGNAADAVRRFESGKARGKVVILVRRG